MKIVCLIQNQPPLVAFANRVHAQHPLDLVIIEGRLRRKVSSLPRRIINKLKTQGPGALLSALCSRLLSRSENCRTNQHDVLTHWFGENWQKIAADVPVLWVDDINGAEAQKKLKDMKADVLLDHGTSILAKEIISEAALALNLHWGLSPYYRGTHCTEWALVNWDPLNIGVTIHKLSQQIDGGDIVGQARAAITPQDTVYSINMQLTHLGTEIVMQVLDRQKAGNELTFHRQDFSNGLLTRQRQWSPHLEQYVAELEQNGGIDRMLKSPARRTQLPIVSLG
ncbi:MAG: hypothetical protein IH899_14730 [Planctomycetes bacterium]|nr:hypothetical protein [Planctomycetota bacterium]